MGANYIHDPSRVKCTNTAFSRVVSHISSFARSISAASCLRRSRARSRIACLSSVPLDVAIILGVDRLDADVAEATLPSARALPFCAAVMRGGSLGSVAEEDVAGSLSITCWARGSKNKICKNNLAWSATACAYHERGLGGQLYLLVHQQRFQKAV